MVALRAMRPSRVFTRFSKVVLPNLRYLPQTQIRKCGCCSRASVIVSLSESDEYKICIRCRANYRYEMLACYIRQSFPELREMRVLELDSRSPLRPLLSQSREYIRTYFSYADILGTMREDGARCEDITRLTLRPESVDLIVSSEVLEHVQDLVAAFRETARILRNGGCHIFTVPPRESTRQKARLENGQIVCLGAPEYHSDPLDPRGILVYWDFGPDAPSVFDTDNLKLDMVKGPSGKSRRVIWRALKGTGVPKSH